MARLGALAPLVPLLLGGPAIGCVRVVEIPPPQADDPLAVLWWMSGSWFGRDGESESEEHWSNPRGGTMVATARTVVGGTTNFFEFMRIEARDGEIFMIAQPKGRSGTEFKLVLVERGKAVFENLEHDFPQRIIYTRKGDRLDARLEGTEGGETIEAEYHWRRARLSREP